MVKTVVVLGASGMLGHKMLQILSLKFDVVGTVRTQNKSQILDSFDLYEGVDVNNFTSVYSALNELNPDIIVNCIGIIKQKSESNNFDVSHRVNSEFPQKLSIYSKSRGIGLIHISSDCVFNGKRGLYKETDIPDAVDIYGRTKFTGEVSGLNSVTLRTSIIGRELNTSHGLLEWFLSQKGLKVQGYTKSIFSGVTTNELSNVVSTLIHRGGKNFSGIYHVASEPITKFDLLTLINSYLKEKDKIIIEPVDGEIINRSLNCNKLKIALNYTTPSWNDMLNEIFIKDKTKYGD